MSTQEKPSIAAMNKAIDLSHHISEVANARKISPLKGLQKYQGRPGLISLAGGMYLRYCPRRPLLIEGIGGIPGMPDPSYFPFESISADVLAPNAFPRTKPSQSSLFSWFWNIFGTSTEKTDRFTVPKFGQPGDIDLATTLQYCEWV